jgi:hypothetical protein
MVSSDAMLSQSLWVIVPIACLCVLYVFARLIWQYSNRGRCIYCGASAGDPHEYGCRAGEEGRW